MPRTPETIDDLKADPQNPRAISPESFKALGVSLSEFGDLSGLTFNSQSGLLVCGHQRLAALKEKHGAALKLEDGAVITPTGERFPIRIVDWPPAKAMAANIAANSQYLAGEYTPALAPMLAQLSTELPELSAALRLGDIELSGMFSAAEVPPPTLASGAKSPWLPRNSESRAIGYAMRWLRKQYPFLKWVVSFADATQSGDGTIYRASGFVLTGIKPNNQIWEAPSGETFNDTSIRPGIGGERERERAKRVFSRTSLTDGRSKQQQQAKAIVLRTTTKGQHILDDGASSMKRYKAAGWKPKPGFQIRYIYFLDPTARERLTVPILPFSEIERRGAGMYKGVKRAGSSDSAAPVHQAGEGGASPTPALHP